MALIRCDECGHEVSDKASACPKCGGPIVLSAATVTAPESVSFNGGRFKGTRAMLTQLAVASIQAVRYKVDDVNESSGVIGFTTGMTMGSWSGVSGTIILTEIEPYVFTATGSGKQNVRGGQMVALDLFGEAKAKVGKVVTEMERRASSGAH